MLETASLGLFLPSHPAGSLAVPSIEPGGSAVVGTSIPLMAPIVPARSLADDRDVSLTPGLPLIERVARARLDASPRATSVLAPDVHTLLGHRRAQWADNLHVQVGDRSTERHRARDLRVRPGEPNLSLSTDGHRPICAVGPLCRLFGLVVRPPAGPGPRVLELHAHHLPSSEVHRLEFDFDPVASGPACVLGP